MKPATIISALSMFIALSGTALAANTDIEYIVEQHRYVENLDKINFLPSLLPVIIENSDVIELTYDQLHTLLEWRKINREGVIATMNEVARKRVEIKEAALSPDISSARLIQMQNDVFRLQREILEYKLSCRDLVIDTFTQHNWEGFFLVLAEEEMGITLPELHASK